MIDLKTTEEVGSVVIETRQLTDPDNTETVTMVAVNDEPRFRNSEKSERVGRIEVKMIAVQDKTVRSTSTGTQIYSKAITAKQIKNGSEQTSSQLGESTITPAPIASTCPEASKDGVCPQVAILKNKEDQDNENHNDNIRSLWENIGRAKLLVGIALGVGIVAAIVAVASIIH